MPSNESISIMSGNPKKRERAERIHEEIMAENFPNLARDVNLKFREAE